MEKTLTKVLPTPIPLSFYDNSTLLVAEKLLGKHLYRRDGEKLWAGKIVEVEAYIGEDDPACHAFRGLTPRTRVMYGPPGHAYVYFTYGVHWMLNVVTERSGFPAAVLIRALEPIFGFTAEDPRPASGPGKLCRSMRIDKNLNGIALNSSELWIAAGAESLDSREVLWSTRIGIRVGTDKRWRAYIADNPFVSRSRDGSVTRPLE
jgi:DNA-3-methyladenine glycosylase